MLCRFSGESADDDTRFVTTNSLHVGPSSVLEVELVTICHHHHAVAGSFHEPPVRTSSGLGGGMAYNGNIVGPINEVAARRARLYTDVGDRLRRAYHPGVFTKPPRPTQPPTLSGTGNEHRPKGGDAMRLGSKAGWFIPHVTCG